VLGDKKKSGQVKGKNTPSQDTLGGVLIPNDPQILPMTQEEITQLKSNIETQLLPEQKRGILPIVKEDIERQKRIQQ
jgi:hypothetical protein